MLLVWLLYQAWRDNPDGWLLPLDPGNMFNVGTVLCQVGVLAVVLFAYNRKLAGSAKEGR